MAIITPHRSSLAAPASSGGRSLSRQRGLPWPAMGREIAEERCVGGRDLTEPRLLPGTDALAYVRSAAGEAVLVVHHFDGTPDTELATAPSIRAGRGLGGGAWWPTPDGRAVVYVGADGNVWRQSLSGADAEQLTNHGPDRAASGVHVAPDGESAVYVIDQAEVWRVACAGGAAELPDPSPRRLHH